MITQFEQKVYDIVGTIPEGQVRTYGWVARKIGNPKAARAVGNALNKNPFAPKVPCHRVVAADGLGGFSRGLAAKRKLLRSEGVRC
ncbi:MGMT family protein [Candidatus Margulisiibacteriota bacterium]